ncbi:hypothetical protein PFISCL1PPCAC_6303, partial [Pristionchus fissidentatus]
QMSFFLTGDSKRKTGKRKAGVPLRANGRNSLEEGPKKSKRKSKLDEVEVSSDEEDIQYRDGGGVESDNESIHEDANQTAFRKAHQLLNSLKADDKDDDEVAARLRDHAAASVGRLHKKVADAVEMDDEDEKRHTKHRFSVVSAAISPCGRYCVSVGKESTVVKYDIDSGEVMGVIKRDKSIPETERKTHGGAIHAVAISPDGRYLVTGGVDAILKVWNMQTLAHVKDLRGHRSAITSLVFRLNSPHLFSVSKDRTARLWDIDQMGFVDSMLGHQDGVVGVTALSRERAVTAGGYDRSVRMWKVQEESQLVFNGTTGCISIECVTMLNEDHFVTGGADGSLSIWSIMKKKPTCTKEKAHGEHSSGESRWIVSLCSVPYTDLLLSGSSDGQLRVWRVAEDYKSVEEVYSYEVMGFINSIAFCPKTCRVVLGVGQEHKMGRWWKDTEARNSVVILRLRGLPELPTNMDETA